MITDARYFKAFGKLFELEGFMSNHPLDPGGHTVYGIAESRHPDMFVAGPPTLENAVGFYWRWWSRGKCDRLDNFAVAFELFEASVLCGEGTARKFLQEAYNDFDKAIPADRALLVVDGVIGPVTLSAVNLFCARGYSWAMALRNRADQRQADRLMEIANPSFVVGWIARRTSNE